MPLLYRARFRTGGVSTGTSSCWMTEAGWIGLFPQNAIQSFLSDSVTSSLCKLKRCALIMPKPTANLQRVQIRTLNLGSKDKKSITMQKGRSKVLSGTEEERQCITYSDSLHFILHDAPTESKRRATRIPVLIRSTSGRDVNPGAG